MERSTHGEENHVTAKTELLYLLGRAVQKHVPQFSIDDKPLEGAVNSAELVDVGALFVVFIVLLKYVLAREVIVNLIIFDSVSIARMVAGKRNAGRLQSLNVAAAELDGP